MPIKGKPKITYHGESIFVPVMHLENAVEVERLIARLRYLSGVLWSNENGKESSSPEAS